MTATMQKYKYVAETLDGQQIKGEIEATSENVARNQLAVEGIRVTKISERKGLNVDITKAKVPLVDVMHFSRQMATFIRSGIGVTEAMETIRRDSKNERFTAILLDLIERVTAGHSLADAVARHDDVFPPYYIAMLSSSELTGRMDEAFDQLHRYLRRDLQLQRAVRKALIYPAILLSVALLVVLIIVVFVIPKFAEFFESFDAELPLPTRILMAIADFVASPAGAITGIALVVAIVSTTVYVRTQAGRYRLHGLLLKVPVLSTVLVYAATERFSRVLAALLDSGVPLPQAMPSAIGCTNNLIFQERLDRATEQVLAGHGFAEPIKSVDLFPATVVQMIRVGERTGELSQQLQNAAVFFEDELDYAVQKLTEMFEPVIILFIGLVVGFVALAMVSAMYGIYNQVDL